MASKAQERYPTAVALGGILRTYSQTRQATNGVERLLVQVSMVAVDTPQVWFEANVYAVGGGRPAEGSGLKYLNVHHHAEMLVSPTH